jgi:hypothetical protein
MTFGGQNWGRRPPPDVMEGAKLDLFSIARCSIGSIIRRYIALELNLRYTQSCYFD